MKFIQFICISVAIWLCYACDTRDDYFYDHNEEPIITLISEKDSTIDGKRYICLDLTWGDTLEIDYKFKDTKGVINDFKSEVKPIIKNRDDYYYWKDLAIVDYHDDGSTDSWYYLGNSPYDYTHFSNHLCVEIDTTRNKIIIIESTSSAQEYYANNGRTNTGKLSSDSLSIDAIITISASNIIGQYGSSNILLKLYANRPPIANFSIEEVTGHPLHRRINAQCIDPDKDDIQLYEYNIDGKLFEHQSGYDWLSEKTKEIGKGAYNGTYIANTRLSSIKHSFQEKGAHTIHLRCQDSWGNWSTWYTKTINIE
ncbi:MAG: hypothetical protein MJZ34_14135 [Paludibacteraceae bacterium]|mgnify:CR=1 FL=1|nr:hypothetical protein [Paludibacteraceae bacterium]